MTSFLSCAVPLVGAPILSTRRMPAQSASSLADLRWGVSETSAAGGMLGIHVDAGARQLRFAPPVPPEWENLRVRQIKLGATTVGLAMRSSRDVVEREGENPVPPLTLQFRPRLANDTWVERVDSSDGSLVTNGAERAAACQVNGCCAAGRTTRITRHVTRRPRHGRIHARENRRRHDDSD